MAVQAGVDTIEHGGWLDEEVVDEMVRRGTWYVPTFAVYRWHGTIGPEFKQIRARGMREDHLKSFALAREAGVRIAMGTDIGGYGYGDTALELELLVEAGMTPGRGDPTSAPGARPSACASTPRSGRWRPASGPTCWSWTATRWRTSPSCGARSRWRW